MIPWVKQEIDRWNHWLDNVIDHSLVPWQLQPGKLLSHTKGDIVEAIKIAKYQGSQDERATAFSEDGYWLQVINYLTQKQVTDLILGE